MQKILIGGLLAATATVALAQPAAVAPPAPARPVMMMAMGGDLELTRAEMVAMATAHFNTMDANKDGAVTKVEADAQHRLMMDRMKDGAMRWDTPDGKHIRMMRGPGMGMHGMGGDPKAAFDRLDTNKDGMISRDEFEKGHAMRVERVVTRTGKGETMTVMIDGKQVDPKTLPPGAMGAGEHDVMIMRHMDHDGKAGAPGAKPMKRMRMMAMGPGMFDTADRNKDGRLTLAEVTAEANARFDKLDTNKDGKVTAAEMKNMRIERRIERLEKRKAG